MKKHGYTVVLISLVLLTRVQAQILEFPCDRWVADPGIQTEYVKWLTARGTAYTIIDSLRILSSTIEDAKAGDLKALKNDYNANVDRFNELIDITKRQIEEFDLVDPKKITVKQIKKFMATIRGHHNLSLHDDYQETLESIQKLTSRMDKFKNEVSGYKSPPALGWVVLVPIVYLMIEFYQDRQSQKLDCLKWKKW